MLASDGGSTPGELLTVEIQSDPDIVNLVEVENAQALQTFNSRYLPGRGYAAYLDDGTDTFTGQDVAMLTRIDPIDFERDGRLGRRGDLRKSVSKNYVAVMEIGEKQVAIIGLHFLAYPTREDRRQKREAQADAIRAMAEEKTNAGCSVIVLGDFNDYDGAADSLDHIDSTPVTTVLAVIRELGSGDTDNLANVDSLVRTPNRQKKRPWRYRQRG